MVAFNREEHFWEHVPRPFMERVLRCIFDSYLRADEHCQEFDKPERANLRPLYRRELIEGNLRHVASRFPDRVSANAVQHEGKGFWYHTRVICGESVALTQNTVKHPDCIVRKSMFRECYTRRDNQLFLFPGLAPEQQPSESLLYGIIVHGRSAESILFPGFVQVRFPMPRLSGYYQTRIDLFKEFPEVVLEKTSNLPGGKGLNTGRPSTELDEIDPELIGEIEPELRDDFDDDLRRSLDG